MRKGPQKYIFYESDTPVAKALLALEGMPWTTTIKTRTRRERRNE